MYVTKLQYIRDRFNFLLPKIFQTIGQMSLLTLDWNMVQFLPTATKLGQGNIFTGVCDSVHRGGLPQCMLGYHSLGPGTPQDQATF